MLESEQGKEEPPPPGPGGGGGAVASFVRCLLGFVGAVGTLILRRAYWVSIMNAGKLYPL